MTNFIHKVGKFVPVPRQFSFLSFLHHLSLILVRSRSLSVLPGRYFVLWGGNALHWDAAPFSLGAFSFPEHLSELLIEYFIRENVRTILDLTF